MGPCCSKPPPPPRRPVVVTAEGLVGCAEGVQRIEYAIQFAPPGTPLRWDKLLLVVNRSIEPTDDFPDPLRVEVDMDEFRKALRLKYNNTTVTNAAGVMLMRDYLPKIYDKHSPERGKRVSQKSRETQKMFDECYAYGELDPETFTTIFTKVTKTFGECDKPIFYDLGCGVGNLVYTAAYIGHFVKCGGIEALDPLLQRGAKRISRFEKYKDLYPESTRDCVIDFTYDDFIERDFWVEATFILLHWTAFDGDKLARISAQLEKCREGTMVVAVTHPVPSTDFDILVKDQCQTSWGSAAFYVMEKITPAKYVPASSIETA